jgi:predicted RNase H-like HicB family nuclease
MKMSDKPVNHKYEVTIRWSDEDGLFIASVPLLPDCVAHGKTSEAALKEINFLIPHWLDVLRESGQPIPSPSTKNSKAKPAPLRKISRKSSDSILDLTHLKPAKTSRATGSKKRSTHA